MNERRDPRSRDTGDDDVRRAYRALGDEPVPPALDARVLAAARAAVDARVDDHAARRRSRRWVVPASLAASVVLAVGVALEVRRDAATVPTAAPEPARAVTFEAAPPAADGASMPAPLEAWTDAARSTDAASPTEPPPPFAAPPPSASPPPLAASPSAEARAPLVDDAMQPPAAPTPASGADRARDPAEWLAAIEALRRAGRVAEADAELAAFRAAHPDHPLP